MPGAGTGPVVGPPLQFVDLFFSFENGGAVIVPPLTLVCVTQLNGLANSAGDDTVRQSRLVGYAARLDPGAALTGATFSIDYADGALQAWQVGVGTAAILVGRRGVQSAAPAWSVPDPLGEGNKSFAVTLLTAPANAVAIAFTIALEVI